MSIVRMRADVGTVGRSYELAAQLQQLDQQISELEREIVLWHRQNDDSRRLERIGGVGPLAGELTQPVVYTG